MWSFSNKNPRPFAPQQVWASSFVIGFILIVFTAIQGMGGHLIGADSAMLAKGFAKDYMHLGKDLMAMPGKQGMIVPALINLLSGSGPWLVLVGIMLLTSLSTQILSNNATAILILPIAISTTRIFAPGSRRTFACCEREGCRSLTRPT